MMKPMKRVLSSAAGLGLIAIALIGAAPAEVLVPVERAIPGRMRMNRTGPRSTY
jgi:hypothetical protein